MNGEKYGIWSLMTKKCHVLKVGKSERRLDWIHRI